MNQSGDRAVGRMADATARKLFNQAALPSHSQGETLHWQMKKEERKKKRKKKALDPVVSSNTHSRIRTHTEETYFTPDH